MFKRAKRLLALTLIATMMMASAVYAAPNFIYIEDENHEMNRYEYALINDAHPGYKAAYLEAFNQAAGASRTILVEDNATGMRELISGEWDSASGNYTEWAQTATTATEPPSYNDMQENPDPSGNPIPKPTGAPTPPTFVPVENITGVPAAATVGEDLTLSGTVNPADATNKAIVWSVSDAGTTGATIDGDIFSSTDAGTATVTATIANGTADGADYTENFDIAVNTLPIVESVSIKTAPTKMVYTEGEALDLTGLVVTLTMNDGSEIEVGLADFSDNGLETSPLNEGTLNLSNTEVVITHTVTGENVKQSITVNPEVKSLKIANEKQIKLVFKSPQTGLVFKIGGSSTGVSAVASADNLEYTITVPTMYDNTQYALTIEKAAKVIYTKTYTYLLVNDITSLVIPEGANNALNKISSANASSLVVKAAFSTVNASSGIASLNVTDKNNKTISFSQEVEAYADSITFSGLDVTDLANGDIVLSAVFTNSDGISSESIELTVVKESSAPKISLLKTTRTAAETATFEFTSSVTSSSDKYYFIVQENTTAVPTVATIKAQAALSTTISKGTSTCTSTTSLPVTNLITGKAYIVYVLVVDAAGNESEIASEIIANNEAAKLLAVAKPTIKGGVSGVVAFTPNVGNAVADIKGYKALLYDGASLKETKDLPAIATEVDFLAEMRKADSASWNIKIITVGDGLTKANSDESLASDNLTTSQLTRPQVIWDTTVPTMLVWGSVPPAEVNYCEGYTLTLKKGTTEVAKKTEITTLYYDFADDIAASGEGVYTVTLVAVAKADSLKRDSEGSVSTGYTSITAPTNFALAQITDTTAKFTIPTIASATYVIEHKASTAVTWTPISPLKTSSAGVDTLSVTGLSSETIYTFRLKITKDSAAVYSNTVNGTTLAKMIYNNPVAKEFVLETKADGAASQDERIKMQADGTTLSVHDGTAVSYTATSPNYAKIYAIVKQLYEAGDITGGNCKITIQNGEIIKITAGYAAAATLTLGSNIAANCALDLTGGSGSTNAVTVYGDIGNGEINLKGTTPVFNLSNLKTTGNIVPGSALTVNVANGSKVKFPDTDAVTVNNIEFTPTANSIVVMTAANNFNYEVGASNNAIKIDASAATADTVVNIVETATTIGSGTIALKSNDNYVLTVKSAASATGVITLGDGMIDISDTKLRGNITVDGNAILPAGATLDIAGISGRTFGGANSNKTLTLKQGSTLIYYNTLSNGLKLIVEPGAIIKPTVSAKPLISPSGGSYSLAAGNIEIEAPGTANTGIDLTLLDNAVLTLNEDHGLGSNSVATDKTNETITLTGSNSKFIVSAGKTLHINGDASKITVTNGTLQVDGTIRLNLEDAATAADAIVLAASANAKLVIGATGRLGVNSNFANDTQAENMQIKVGSGAVVSGNTSSPVTGTLSNVFYSSNSILSTGIDNKTYVFSFNADSSGNSGWVGTIIP